MRKVFKLIPVLVLAGLLGACASGPPPKHYDAPPPALPSADKELFEKALALQNSGQYQEAIKLWKRFLARHPNSYEAHNNLGLVYYTEDRLTESIQEFEAAYRLEPISETIRKNLARALMFQATLFHENRDYERAIQNLERLKEISPPEERQDLEFKIENIEDALFEEVKRANTIEAYEDFLKKHPKGLNADAARERLRDLRSNLSETMPLDGTEPVSPTTGTLFDPQPQAEASEIMEEEFVEESLQESPAKEARIGEPAPAEPPAMDPEPGIQLQPAPEAVPTPVPVEQKTESGDDTLQLAELYKTVAKVQVRVEEGTTLNVRAAPSLKGRIVGKLRNRDVRPLLDETSGWFQVEYETGRSGWISRKFARRLRDDVPPSGRGFNLDRVSRFSPER